MKKIIYIVITSIFIEILFSLLRDPYYIYADSIKVYGGDVYAKKIDAGITQSTEYFSNEYENQSSGLKSSSGVVIYYDSYKKIGSGSETPGDISWIIQDNNNYYNYSTFIGGGSFYDYYFQMFGDQAQEIWNSSSDEDKKLNSFDSKYKECNSNAMPPKAGRQVYICIVPHELKVVDEAGYDNVSIDDGNFYIFFIDDKLTIEKNKTINTSNGSLVVFIVRDKIEIKEDSSNSLNGIYISDKDITIDKRDIYGTVITKKRIKYKNDVNIYFDPSYTFNIPYQIQRRFAVHYETTP